MAVAVADPMPIPEPLANLENYCEALYEFHLAKCLKYLQVVAA